MKNRLLAALIIIQVIFQGCSHSGKSPDDFRELAEKNKDHLQLSTYVTAHTVQQMFTTDSGRREVLSLLNNYGITKVYIEVYRSGLVITPGTIKQSVSFLEENGFEVVGGIATVPGNNFGVQQEGQLEWFNWQNPKTQNDLRAVIEDSAPFFSKFIIDDFLCTSDTSMESKAAKGDKGWPEYRRKLLTELAQSVFIEPAKKVNPGIKLIIKYPQWYDRFHLFGYDVKSESDLFDGVWVGTESRGQYTQRFGYVQPYEGFINYRWIASIAGDKTGGAWFDHGDCTGQDFLEQAYQAVLAGARELVLFSFDSFISGHEGHPLLIGDFEKLADLARAVAAHPVTGPRGYKPPSSDAGGDMYIMDYIGMLGVSLVPVSEYPDTADVIFLPTQAASDKEIIPRIMRSLENGAKIIMTAGFIANSPDPQKLSSLAQVRWTAENERIIAETVISNGNEYKLNIPLIMYYDIIPDGAEILLLSGGEKKIPFLVRNSSGNVYVMNSHTFSQEDFDAVGEVLLCPRQIGLLELPDPWTDTLRAAFGTRTRPLLSAPPRVAMQELSDGSLVIHNYNQDSASIHLSLTHSGEMTDCFTGKKISPQELKIKMAPRTNIWLRKSNE